MATKTTDYVSADFDNNGVSKSNSSIISAEQAVKLMTSELTAANNIEQQKDAATVTAAAAGLYIS